MGRTSGAYYIDGHRTVDPGEIGNLKKDADILIKKVSVSQNIPVDELLNKDLRLCGHAIEKYKRLKHIRTCLVQLLYELGLKGDDQKKLFGYNTNTAITNHIKKHADLMRFEFKDPTYKLIYFELKTAIQ